MPEYLINHIRRLVREFVAEHSELRLSIANEPFLGWIDDPSERQALIDLIERIQGVTR